MPRPRRLRYFLHGNADLEGTALRLFLRVVEQRLRTHSACTGPAGVMQQRLDHQPEKMRVRRQTVEHPFGTIKFWMGSTHFLAKTLARVSTEMSLHVLRH